MWFSFASSAIVLAIGFSPVFARTTEVAIHTRDAPSKTSADTIRALERALMRASLGKRNNVFRNSTFIEKSWTDVTLYSYEEEIQKGNATATAAVDIICTTCYVKTKATAQLSVNGNLNATSTINNVTLQIGQQFDNITTTVIDYVEDYVDKTISNLADGFDTSDFVFPPIQVDFHIDMPEIPEALLSFQFDDMELYVLLDTVLSGSMTYTLNLYTSNTAVGISISDELMAGVIFKIDLILSAEAEVDISSGFHIKLDDGVVFDIALFGQNVSDSTFNGGSFEFLPVTIKGVNAVINAVLRVGVSAGFDLQPSVSSDFFDISAGVMVGVFAHIAEFTTNVTLTPSGEDDGCALRVQESYQLAVGAVAGATVALDDHTWGPVPATTVPVFYTTIADVCASTKASTASSISSSVIKRQDLTTTTLENVDTYTGVRCLSTGLVNCPASLQTTTITSTTKFLVTSVASGVTATWPASVLSSVSTTIPFGTAARDLFATSGTPTSFVPTPSSIADDVSSFVNSVDKRVIIGVSVGVGGALILGVIGACLFCRRRRRYVVVPKAPPPVVFTPISTPYSASYDKRQKIGARISLSQR